KQTSGSIAFLEASLQSPSAQPSRISMKDLSRVVHHPAVSHEGFASLTVPTYRASTIVFEDAEAYAKRKYRGPDGYTYGLHGTPTTRTLEAQLSALEQSAGTVIVPSGKMTVRALWSSADSCASRVRVVG